MVVSTSVVKNTGIDFHLLVGMQGLLIFLYVAGRKMEDYTSVFGTVCGCYTTYLYFKRIRFALFVLAGNKFYLAAFCKDGAGSFHILPGLNVGLLHEW